MLKYIPSCDYFTQIKSSAERHNRENRTRTKRKLYWDKHPIPISLPPPQVAIEAFFSQFQPPHVQKLPSLTIPIPFLHSTTFVAFSLIRVLVNSLLPHEENSPAHFVCLILPIPVEHTSFSSIALIWVFALFYPSQRATSVCSKPWTWECVFVCCVNYFSCVKHFPYCTIHGVLSASSEDEFLSSNCFSKCPFLSVYCYVTFILIKTLHFITVNRLLLPLAVLQISSNCDTMCSFVQGSIDPQAQSKVCHILKWRIIF